MLQSVMMIAGAAAITAPAIAGPVNAVCPIGKEPIVHSAGTVEHNGKSIGLCCPGCGEAFLAWDEDRKDVFVANAMSKEATPSTPGAAPVRTPKDAASRDEAEERDNRVVRAEDGAAVRDQLMHYPLEACLVSGQPLGSMGDPVNMLVDGRLVRLCCAGCIGALETDPDASIDKMNGKIVERQAEWYPLDTCVISGAELGSMGEPVNVLHEYRLARLCCAGCVEAFNADPDAAMAMIDAAYADAQREGYPLGICVVSGAELGSMGEPVELVAGTRLVRFCCAACVPRFKESPRVHLMKISRE